MVGVAVTVMVVVLAAPWQLAAEVPTTVYVAGELVGVTVTLEPDVPLNPPPAEELQVYVLAPLAVKVVLPDEQTVALLAVKVKVGNGFTVTVTVAGVAFVQLAVLVPVTL